MQPHDDIEKRLRETPLPGLKDGPHRDALKQSLLADMLKETAMNEKASISSPVTQPARVPQRRIRWRWVAGSAIVAVVALVIGWQKVSQMTEPLAVKEFAMTGKRSSPPRNFTTDWATDDSEALPARRLPALSPASSSESKGDSKAGKDVGKTLNSKDGGLLADTETSRNDNAVPFPNHSEKGKTATALAPLESVITNQKLTSHPSPNPVPISAPPVTPSIPGPSQDKDNKDAAALPASPPPLALHLPIPSPVPGPVPSPIPPPAPSVIEPSLGGDNYAQRRDNPFHKPAQTPLSTFSIDVDTASYTNVRRFVMQERRLPPADAVRIEEMVNYFSYDDPRPDGGKPVAIKADVGPCPWNADHKLVRIGLRAKSVTAEDSPARNLVFLIDTSGSMASPDRLPLLKKGLSLLVGTLRPQDRVGIIAYAGSAGRVLPSTSGDDRETILAALNRLESGGSTNGGEGIVLAYKLAQESFIKDGVNRVILGTDGDFNVGVTSQADLVRLIEEKRKIGILLSILGFGHGNLKDATMEKLAHHGNGHYAYIDNLEEAHRIFVEQGAALQVVAYDVKVQIEFNPARVAAYRLVGYENRLMKDRDFNDDTKDAGDMGSGHAVTALYEIVPTGRSVRGVNAPGGEPLRYQAPAPKVEEPEHGLTDAAKSSELMMVKVRYKDPGADVSKLLTRPVADVDRPLAETSVDFRFAAAVAEFALILRESPYKGTANLDNVLEQARASIGPDFHGHRAAFVSMVQAARQLRK